LLLALAVSFQAQDTLTKAHSHAQENFIETVNFEPKLQRKVVFGETTVKYISLQDLKRMTHMHRNDAKKGKVNATCTLKTRKRLH
jgi:hypothetical protein